jgi:hypothetical protein
VSWSEGDIDAALTGISLAYGGDRFITVRNDNVSYSDDGISWVFGGTIPSGFRPDLAVWGNGTFVLALQSQTAFNSNQVATSPDGITWTLRALPINGLWERIVWNGDLFVLLRYSGASFLTSPDGITWTARAQTIPVRAAGAGNGRIVVLGASFSSPGIAYISDDGITFTSHAAAVPVGSWQNPTWNGSVFCAMEYAFAGLGRVMTSPDGISWTVYTGVLPAADTLGTSNFLWKSVAAEETTGIMFAAADQGNTTAYSEDDGVTWTTELLPYSPSNKCTVAYGGGIVVHMALGQSSAYQSVAVAPDEPIDFWGGLIGTTQS